MLRSGSWRWSRARPQELPTYLFKHPESEAAQALMALPDDPDQVPKAIAQTTWNIGCTTKFAWPIADHGLARRLHRIVVPTLVLWGREDALVPVVYAEEFASRIEGSQRRRCSTTAAMRCRATSPSRR